MNYPSLIPVAEHGFGMALNQYASGRVSASVAGHGGLTMLRFYGNQPHAHSTFFEASEIAAFSKLFRLQVIINDEPYYLEFNQTQHTPFGYRSECCLENVTIQHDLLLDQQVIYQRIKVLANPNNCDVRVRQLLHGHLMTSVENRDNQEWTIQSDGSLRTCCLDQQNSHTYKTEIAVGANRPLKTHAAKKTFKYYTETTEHADSTIFYLAFNHTPETDTLDARIDQKFENYVHELTKGLRFETGNATLDSALSNTVPTILSLELADHRGAIRASQSYWVWAWDCMVHAEALIWSGHTRAVRDMLQFFEATSHPEQGVAHALHSDFTLQYSMAPSAQCLYVVLLYNYYAATGDQKTLQKYLPFAKQIIAKAGIAQSKHNSLSTGMGFFPDHPEQLEQTANDISLINNSLYLQALYAMNELDGGHEEAVKALRHDMETVLWDPEVNYWVDSASSNDLEQRKYYPAYGQLYVSPFGCKPKQESTQSIGTFLRKHSLFEYGIYMFPKGLPGFMADGNQLGAYYPSADRYYWNIMNRCGHSASASDFERIVCHFWKEHTYPEGLTHETANAAPATDNPGCKQTFAASSWCCDGLELNLGLRVQLHGFSLNPLPSDQTFKVSGLVLRSKLISIERVPGTEQKPTIWLNGHKAQLHITWDELEDENTIRIEVPTT